MGKSQRCSNGKYFYILKSIVNRMILKTVVVNNYTNINKKVHALVLEKHEKCVAVYMTRHCVPQSVPDLGQMRPCAIVQL